MVSVCLAFIMAVGTSWMAPASAGEGTEAQEQDSEDPALGEVAGDTGESVMETALPEPADDQGIGRSEAQVTLGPEEGSVHKEPEVTPQQGVSDVNAGETKAPEGPGEAETQDPGRSGGTEAQDPGQPGGTEAQDPGQPGGSEAQDPGQPGGTEAQDPEKPDGTEAQDTEKPGETEAQDPGGSQGETTGTEVSHPDAPGCEDETEGWIELEEVDETEEETEPEELSMLHTVFEDMDIIMTADGPFPAGAQLLIQRLPEAEAEEIVMQQSLGEENPKSDGEFAGMQGNFESEDPEISVYAAFDIAIEVDGVIVQPQDLGLDNVNISIENIPEKTDRMDSQKSGFQEDTGIYLADEELSVLHVKDNILDESGQIDIKALEEIPDKIHSSQVQTDQYAEALQRTDLGYQAAFSVDSLSPFILFGIRKAASKLPPREQNYQGSESTESLIGVYGTENGQLDKKINAIITKPGMNPTASDSAHYSGPWVQFNGYTYDPKSQGYMASNKNYDPGMYMWNYHGAMINGKFYNLRVYTKTPDEYPAGNSNYYVYGYGIRGGVSKYGVKDGGKRIFLKFVFEDPDTGKPLLQSAVGNISTAIQVTDMDNDARYFGKRESYETWSVPVSLVPSAPGYGWYRLAGYDGSLGLFMTKKEAGYYTFYSLHADTADTESTASQNASQGGVFTLQTRADSDGTTQTDGAASFEMVYYPPTTRGSSFGSPTAMIHYHFTDDSELNTTDPAYSQTLPEEARKSHDSKVTVDNVKDVTQKSWGEFLPEDGNILNYGWGSFSSVPDAPEYISSGWYKRPDPDAGESAYYPEGKSDEGWFQHPDTSDVHVYAKYVKTSGSLNVQKVSADENVTKDNPNYSLKGAAFRLQSDEFEIQTSGAKLSDAMTKLYKGRYMDKSGNEVPFYEAVKYAGTYDQTLMTDENGHLSFPCVPYGVPMTLTEITPSSGYLSVSKPVKITLKKGEKEGTYQQPVTVKEPPVTVKIAPLLRKTAAGNTNAPLSDARFTVKYYSNSDGSGKAGKTWIIRTIEEKGEDGKPAYFARLDTDHLVKEGSDPLPEDGKIPLGVLMVQETAAPEGFSVNPAIYMISISQDPEDRSRVRYVIKDEKGNSLPAGDLTLAESCLIKVSDTPAFGDLELTKVDAELTSASGDAKLEGAVYEIFSDNDYSVIRHDDEKTAYEKGSGIAVATIVTDGSGIAKTSGNLLQAGSYIVKEKTPSEGMKLSQNEFQVKVMADQVTRQTVEQKPLEDPEPVIRAGFRITKTDLELKEKSCTVYGAPAALFRPDHKTSDGNVTQGDSVLKGAEFTLTNQSKASVKVEGKTFEPGQVIMTFQTDENGVYQSSPDLLPYGTYQITETKAPEGFNLRGKHLDETFKIRQEDEGSIKDLSSISAEDDVIRFDIEISKCDKKSGAPLEGAVFEIYLVSADKEPYATLTTDHRGFASTKDPAYPHGRLPYGKYRIIEKTPPAGYKSSGEIIVNGTGRDMADQSVKSVTIKDEPLSLTVEKKVSGNMGSKEKEFHFSLKLSGKVIPDKIICTKNGKTSILKGEKGAFGFTLRHGEDAVLGAIPEGTAYKVTEEEANKDNYITTVSGKQEGTLTDSTKIIFKNRYDTIIPTGVNLGNWEYILLVTAAMAGILMVLHHRKSQW